MKRNGPPVLWGFGDLHPQAYLKWNSGVNNFMIYGFGDTVGAYDWTRLANLGIGHGAADAGVTYTACGPYLHCLKRGSNIAV